MDAQNTKGDHPAWCSEQVVHFAGLLYREGRHVQRAFAKTDNECFFPIKDAEVADLTLGDDVALELVLAGEYR